MADNRHGRQQNKGAYVYGNTARRLDVQKAIEEKPTGEPLRIIRGNRRLERKMTVSFPYVLFLMLAMCTLGVSLVKYLEVQSDITCLSENISTYEARLNNLTLANDDEYSKMINATDLEEIREIAINELGMVYASEDQIITYTRENSDYVRQLNDLSK